MVLLHKNSMDQKGFKYLETGLDSIEGKIYGPLCIDSVTDKVMKGKFVRARLLLGFYPTALESFDGVGRSPAI